MFYRVFRPHPVDGVMVASGKVAHTLADAVQRAQALDPAASVRPHGQNITVWTRGMFFFGKARDMARAFD